MSISLPTTSVLISRVFTFTLEEGFKSYFKDFGNPSTGASTC